MIDHAGMAPQISPITAADMAPGFYVLDIMASTWEKAVVSGPHTTAGLAETDRRERNIAGDCVLGEVAA